MTIQCSLIEFLESTAQGLSYRFGTTQGPYEYFGSKKLLVQFLCNRDPFSRYFTDRLQAKDFYESVRCGLLHEAQTKSDWKIRAGKGKGKGVPIDLTNRIVYPTEFQAPLEEFITWYERTLPTDRALQAAFLRKFDSLCR